MLLLIHGFAGPYPYEKKIFASEKILVRPIVMQGGPAAEFLTLEAKFHSWGNNETPFLLDINPLLGSCFDDWAALNSYRAGSGEPLRKGIPKRCRSRWITPRRDLPVAGKRNCE